MTSLADFEEVPVRARATRSKTQYFPYTLELTPAQSERLINLESIELSGEALASAGNSEILLTKTQIAKIEKARSAGKGTTLKLSLTQLERMSRAELMGAGIFGDTLRSIGRFGKRVGNMAWEGVKAQAPVLKKLGARAINQWGPSAVDYAKKQIGDRLDSVVENEVAARYLQMGLDWGAKLSREQLEALSRGLVRGSGVKGLGLFLPGTV